MEKIQSNEIRNEMKVEEVGFKMGRERLRWYGNMKRMHKRRIIRKKFENKAVGRRKRVVRPRE
jgi:hypothetical protein